MANNPTLYLFVRNDVPSMTPGRAIAQASHATNAFELHLRMLTQSSLEWAKIMEEWRPDPEPAGRALVFGCTGRQLDFIEAEINSYMKYTKENFNLLGGTYMDPTYVLKDGDVTHLVPFKSCGWMFARAPINTIRKELRAAVDGWQVNLEALANELDKLSLY